jgi:hypothetical protein
MKISDTNRLRVLGGSMSDLSQELCALPGCGSGQVVGAGKWLRGGWKNFLQKVGNRDMLWESEKEVGGPACVRSLISC